MVSRPRRVDAPGISLRPGGRHGAAGENDQQAAQGSEFQADRPGVELCEASPGSGLERVEGRLL